MSYYIAPARIRRDADLLRDTHAGLAERLAPVRAWLDAQYRQSCSHTAERWFEDALAALETAVDVLDGHDEEIDDEANEMAAA
jgi:hypothetical protein